MISKIIYLMGKPGVGKSTVVKNILQKNPKKYKELCLGYIFRMLSKFNSSLREMLKNPTSQKYIPSLNKIATNLVLDFKLMKCDKVLLVDGFPRYPDQLLTYSLIDNNIKCYFIHIDVEDNELLWQRIDNRNEKRLDDNREVFLNRIIDFNKEIKILSKIIKENYTFETIITTNNTSIEELTNKIINLTNE